MDSVMDSVMDGSGGSAGARVLHYLDRSAGVSRKTLSLDLGLPTATVASVIGRLVRAGTVEEVRDDEGAGRAGRAGSVGRPAGIVRLAGQVPVLGVLGWDEGKLTASLVTYAAEVLAREQFDVGARPEQVEELEPAWQFLLAGCASRAIAPDERTLRLTGVVIGVPAPFQPGVGLPRHRAPAAVTAGAEESGFTPWLRVDPIASLTARLQVPVLVENNANLAALGEFTNGVAAGHRDLIYLRVGDTGIGAGVLIDGRLHRGASGFAGELGHVHVNDDGPMCACGGRGCLNSRLGAAVLDTVQPLYAEPLTMADLIDLANAAEPAPVRALTDVGRILGRPLADLCTFLNPSAVVVGGTVGGACELVADGIREQIDRYAAPTVSAAVRTARSELGPAAELFGAVRLAQVEL